MYFNMSNNSENIASTESVITEVKEVISDSPSMLTTLLPLLICGIAFYFLVINPQRKKMKEHKGMLASLKKGDRFVTSGGIFGKVSKIEDDCVYAIISTKDDIEVKVSKNFISEILKD